MQVQAEIKHENDFFRFVIEFMWRNLRVQVCQVFF